MVPSPDDLRFYRGTYWTGRLCGVRSGQGFTTVPETNMSISKNRGTPKWMVYNGNPIKIDDLGVPLFSETPIWQWNITFL